MMKMIGFKSRINQLILKKVICKTALAVIKRSCNSSWSTNWLSLVDCSAVLDERFLNSGDVVIQKKKILNNPKGVS